MTIQPAMTTPRPKLTPDLTFLTQNTYVLICNMPIFDILIWTPMTTLVMTPQEVMTTPWPELTQGLTFLTSNNYVLTSNILILHDNWFEHLWPLTTLVMAIQAVMTTPRPKLTPGYDIFDLKYPQLDIKNVKIGLREGEIRFWTKIDFLNLCG